MTHLGINISVENYFTNMKKALTDEDKDEFEKLKHRFNDDEWEKEFDYLLIEDYGTSGLNGNHKLMGDSEYDSLGDEIDGNNRFQKFNWGA